LGRQYYRNLKHRCELNTIYLRILLYVQIVKWISDSQPPNNIFEIVILFAHVKMCTSIMNTWKARLNEQNNGHNEHIRYTLHNNTSFVQAALYGPSAGMPFCFSYPNWVSTFIKRSSNVGLVLSKIYLPWINKQEFSYLDSSADCRVVFFRSYSVIYCKCLVPWGTVIASDIVLVEAIEVMVTNKILLVSDKTLHCNSINWVKRYNIFRKFFKISHYDNF